jgi:hypothetical protein
MIINMFQIYWTATKLQKAMWKKLSFHCHVRRNLPSSKTQFLDVKNVLSMLRLQSANGRQHVNMEKQ